MATEQSKTPLDTELEIAKMMGTDKLNQYNKDGTLVHDVAAFPMPGGLTDIPAIAKWETFFAENKDEIFKSIGMPPAMQPFSRLTTMPDESFNGILQWPGPLPSTLYKIGTEHIAAQMIISQRVGDIQQYSKLSHHFWRPGWRIEMRASGENPSTENLKRIREAETFIYNCNNEITDARQRDAKRLKNFPTFLAATVRAFLMYDTVSIWTDSARDGTVKAFAAMDPAIIRLVNQEVGYDGDKNIVAVGINEAMQVNKTFRRDEIVWYVGNPRLDVNVFGYGYSRLEVCARLIEAFSNAMELNMDAFNKNAIPPAILKLKGTFTQKQIDFMNRLWTNIRKGASKNWVFPVVKVPADGDVDILDLSRMKGIEVYYKEFMNMLMGAMCAAFDFPVHRLGYKTSGTQQDEKPEDIPSWIDENDIGKVAMLGLLETVINEYILWPKYPELQFCFTGKSPKEDSREYETRTLSMTFDERRALVDLPPMHEVEVDESELEEDEVKQLQMVKRIMGLMPVDPGVTGVFQSVVSALIKSKQIEEAPGEPGAKFPAQKDPARSAKHSHEPGIRRDSSKERKSAGKK